MEDQLQVNWLDLDLSSIYHFDKRPSDNENQNANKKIKSDGSNLTFNNLVGIKTITKGDAGYDGWDNSDLQWEEAPPLMAEFDESFNLKGNNNDLERIVLDTYAKIESKIPIEWSKNDQSSRFITSFKTPQVKHKHAANNPPYKYSHEEEKRLARNCESWLHMIKTLKIEKESDLRFILRPDFPDVIAQILGLSTKGRAALLNLDYEFNLRLTPSMIEKKILETKELFKNSNEIFKYKAQVRSKIGNKYDASTEEIIAEIIRMYSTYDKIREEHDSTGGILYMKTGDKNDSYIKLRFKDYRTKENIIRKHILRHFKSNKHISTYLVKRMKLYDERIAYVRDLPDDIFNFQAYPYLKRIEDQNSDLTMHALFLKYRKGYLSLKGISRLIRSDKVKICGTYSQHPRSTYYRYSSIFANIDLDGKKIMVITTDKTINDVTFRFLKNVNCFIDVYGDFNYTRLGNEYVDYIINRNPDQPLCTSMRKIRCYPTIDINVNTPYHQYDYVIIDTICLAVLRNSVVYGDFQEAQDYANLVIDSIADRRKINPNINTNIILRAGMANICYDKAPLKYNKTKIEDIRFFKANGPESIIRMSFVQDGSSEGTNDLLIRRAILMKLLVVEDLAKLATSGIKYLVRPPGGFYPTNVTTTDEEIYLRLTGKKGNYLAYSKTRNTTKFQNGRGVDIIQTYLVDSNLRSSLNARTINRNTNKDSSTFIDKPLSVFLASGNRNSRIISALVKNDYSINDAFFDLNSEGDYTMDEISAAFMRCITLPISDTVRVSDSAATILNAIRYVIRYAPNYRTFIEKYPSLKNNIYGRNKGDHEYFDIINDENGNEIIRFRGLTEVCEQDLYEPLLVKANSILEYGKKDIFTEYAIIENQLNQNCMSPYYEPKSPSYNPVSPQY